MSERSKVAMIIPPPIALAIALLSVAVLPAFIGSYDPFTAHSPAGITLAIASLAILLASERAFRSAGTPVRPITPTLSVVRSGPYKYSRNPMYLAMVGIVTGVGLITANHVFVPVAVCFAIVLHFGAIVPEERYLARQLPHEAAAYFKQVRRWI